MVKENILEKGEKVAKKVALVILLFAVLKGIVGFVSGSVALSADFLHSLSDFLAVALIWLGFKISQRKPTEKFPYGFYKSESLVSLIVSLLIIFAAYEIGSESYQRIFSVYHLRIPLVAIAVAFFDAIFIYFLGRYEIKIGKEINSQSLMVEGKESKMHIFSSSIVLFGLLSSYFQIPHLEGIVGILLSLFVFKIGVESSLTSLSALMDVSPSKEIEEKIKKILRSKEIEGFSDLKLRKSGPFIFGEVKVKIKKFLEVGRAHEITDEIENKIKKEIPQVDSFLIHIEPFKEKERKIAIPVDNKEALNSKISSHLSRAHFFVFIKIKEKKIEKINFEENPYREKEIRAGLAVGEYLAKEKIDVLITKEIGPISLHFLRDHLIEVFKTDKENLSQVLDDFFKEKLTILKEPTREKI